MGYPPNRRVRSSNTFWGKLDRSLHGTPSNTHLKKLHFLPNILRIITDNVGVIAVKLDKQPYKVLLGRDVLSRIINYMHPIDSL